MANKKISELPYISNTDIGGLDLVPLVTYFSSVTGDTVHTYISDLQSTILSATPISYSSFTTLITNSGLTQGSFYLINDFRTCYDQPDFDVNNGPITTGNYKQGPIEPIMVLATSNDTISTTVYQPSYPNDRIQYDWTWNFTEVTSGTSYGRITERIDEFNNRTDYDHRNILFKRYRLFTYRQDQPLNGTIELLSDGTINGTDTSFTALTVGDVVYIPTTFPSYYEIVSITGNTAMTVSGDTITAVGTGQQIFPTIEETNGSGYFSYKQTNVKTNDFIEYTTFGDAISNDYAKNNYVGNFANNYQNISSGVFILANNVFLEGQYESNKFGDYCYNNTFGTDNQNNIWGDWCYENASTNDIDDNIIGHYFNNNLINVNLTSNHIGNDFYSNKLLAENGENFEDNIIGNGFNNNIIYSWFYKNEILDEFNENVIGDYSNLSNFEFYRNYIRNNFNNNTIRQNFQNNQIGTNYQENTINGESKGNTILNGFNNNNIGPYFNLNNIGNGFNKNIIGNSFLNNAIGNNFGLDSIGTGGNKIGAVTTVYYDNLQGPVSGITLTSGGTGYSDSTNVPTTGGLGGSLTVDILTDGLGVITGATINAPGTYYQINDSITITTGGNDATFNVTGITSFQVGNVVDNGVGGTAEVVTDDGFSAMTVNLYIGGFTNGDTIDNGVDTLAGVTSVEVTLGDAFFEDNHIGNHFINNNIGSGFTNNQIGNYFGSLNNTGISNYILNDFNSNIIGNYFGIDNETPDLGDGGNIIRNNFIQNTIGDSFTYNITYDTSGGGYNNNQIGWSCNNNVFGDGFNYNRIGDLFQENLLGINFGGNEIGYFFNVNEVNDNAGYNRIGDVSWFNVIGTGFESNKAGVSFFANTIGNDFVHNTIGNYFGQFFVAGNTWGDNVYDNQFGDHTYGNEVGSNFNNNNIFNNFIGNTVGDDFQYNVIDAEVNGYDFTSNPATHVYSVYTCTIFTNSSPNLRLSYYDALDNIVITDPDL
jgi:hypothetical protein